MLLRLCVLLALLGGAVVSGDDGLCSIEGPGPDGSCSGRDSDDSDAPSERKQAGSDTYDFEEKPMTAEEAEVWAKRFYGKMSFTDEEVDWPLRDELDLADDHIVNEPAAAIEMFDAILAKEPRSTRAFYAKTRALEFLDVETLEGEQLEQRRREIIDRYLELLTRPGPDLLNPIYNSAASQAVMAATVLNDTEVTLTLVRTLISGRFSENAHTHESLIHALFLDRRFQECLEAVEVAADKFPQFQIFMFYKGVLLKLLDRKKDGNRLLRSLEMNPTNAFEQANELLHFCYLLLLRGHTREMDMIYQEASKLHLFISKDQRPLEAVEDLESKPIWSPEDTGLTTHDEEFESLTAAWADIRDEALELAANLTEWTNATHHLDKGQWLQYPLYSWGKRRMGHCAKAPKTCALLKAFPASSRCNKCVARFDLMLPGTHVHAHTGPTNTRIRVDLGLKTHEKARMRVGRQGFVHRRDGQLSVYDDTFDHEEWNEHETEPRLLLALYVPHPDLPVHHRANTFTKSGKYSFEAY